MVMAGKSSSVMGREWVLIVVTTGWNHLLGTLQGNDNQFTTLYLLFPTIANGDRHVDCEGGREAYYDEP